MPHHAKFGKRRNPFMALRLKFTVVFLAVMLFVSGEVTASPVSMGRTRSAIESSLQRNLSGLSGIFLSLGFQADIEISNIRFTLNILDTIGDMDKDMVESFRFWELKSIQKLLEGMTKKGENAGKYAEHLSSDIAELNKTIPKPSNIGAIEGLGAAIKYHVNGCISAIGSISKTVSGIVENAAWSASASDFRQQMNNLSGDFTSLQISCRQGKTAADFLAKLLRRSPIRRLDNEVLSGDQKVSIFDLTGRLLLEIKEDHELAADQLKAQRLAKGVYLVEVRGTVKKFVLQ